MTTISIFNYHTGTRKVNIHISYGVPQLSCNRPTSSASDRSIIIKKRVLHPLYVTLREAMTFDINTNHLKTNVLGILLREYQRNYKGHV